MPFSCLNASIFKTHPLGLFENEQHSLKIFVKSYIKNRLLFKKNALISQKLPSLRGLINPVRSNFYAVGQKQSH